MEFTYRSATKNDVNAVMLLGQRSYGKYLPLLTPENQQKLMTNLANKENAISLINDSTSFLCEAEGRIAGMAYLFSSGKGWEFFPPEWSYIRMLGVDPEFEGRGIARALTGKCIEHARRTNEKTLALHTSEKMNAARHIYESMGFKVLKELEPRLGMRYWLYTLEL